jgi:hypothetical protein
MEPRGFTILFSKVLAKEKGQLSASIPLSSLPFDAAFTSTH